MTWSYSPDTVPAEFRLPPERKRPEPQPVNTRAILRDSLICAALSALIIPLWLAFVRKAG